MAVDRNIPEEIQSEIQRRLDTIEHENNVTILLACESGSRAWGFASSDSDYDVRFIYLRHPDWYLAVDLEEKRDVIETPIEGVWDINGWDLRKALRLYRKSNPPLLEWLQSPIIYRRASSAAADMEALLQSYYSPSACMYHYLHMAHTNFRGYLQSETVRTKKYFYVLRPLLGCRWLERELGAVPMEFELLVENVELPSSVTAAIAELLTQKRQSVEIGEEPRNQTLNEFIESEFQRHEESGLARKKPQTDVSQLNEIFHKALKDTYGYEELHS